MGTQLTMNTSFEMTLWDDDETHCKLTALNCLETLFDHSRNTLPPEYFYFSDQLPIGARVRITLEVIE
jgi:hypothetical protein